MILSQVGQNLDSAQLKLIINEVSYIDFPLMSPSIVAIEKHTVLTNGAYLDDPHNLAHTKDEAHLDILANFIEQCQLVNEPLFKGCETLEMLGSFVPRNPSGESCDIAPAVNFALHKLLRAWLSKS